MLQRRTIIAGAVLALGAAACVESPTPAPGPENQEETLIGRAVDPAAALGSIVSLMNWAGDKRTANQHRRADVLTMFCNGETVGEILVRCGYTPKNIRKIIEQFVDIACGLSDPDNPPPKPARQPEVASCGRRNVS
ncbi:MAG: hypothetical protein F4060_09400 [Holophagales bacterium]|nr:hypothetical protein [Holophagales bacterium]MYG31023.1 hypothetical protein [Holophagales bacterium]MYI80147.1 hypothetical protein [Holophagales bacterium]